MKYTVLGLHDETLNRFAQSCQARDPEQAIAKARKDHPGLLVAGVVEGVVQAVDTGTYGSDSH